jgi:hypothetical protein
LANIAIRILYELLKAFDRLIPSNHTQCIGCRGAKSALFAPVLLFRGLGRWEFSGFHNRLQRVRSIGHGAGLKMGCEKCNPFDGRAPWIAPRLGLPRFCCEDQRIQAGINFKFSKCAAKIKRQPVLGVCVASGLQLTCQDFRQPTGNGRIGSQFPIPCIPKLVGKGQRFLPTPMVELFDIIHQLIRPSL